MDSTGFLASIFVNIGSKNGNLRRALLAHSTNFLKLAFMVVKIFVDEAVLHPFFC